tara:strand:+ start:263 stop:733 length:471 start_codon:yes stop_codon:yes gene_type:complete
MSLDQVDIKILDLLQSDANLTTAEVAEKVHLSQSPCRRRIHRYQDMGIVSGKVCILDREALGMQIVVFTTIKLSRTSGNALSEFEAAVGDFPEIVECYTMTGTMDYMLKIVAKDIRHYEQFVRTNLVQLPNIGEFHSHVAVTRIKDTTALPLMTQL